MARKIHLLVAHRGADRSNAGIAASRGLMTTACYVGSILQPGQRDYRLTADPSAVTCPACRSSWEFGHRVRQDDEAWLRRQLATLVPLA
jgi:hypothetical protein